MAELAYASVQDFKDWVGLTDGVDDDTIQAAVLAASRGVDNFCHTNFLKSAAATVRIFDTCDWWRVRIDDAVAVTEVATDPTADGTYDVVWAGTDWQLLPFQPAGAPEAEPFTQIHAIGALTFPRVTGPTMRHGLIRVTGTWGWPAIPDAVVQATLLLANRLVKRRRSPEGVAGFDEFGTVRISSRDDPDAVRYLEPYKTSRRAGGWAFA